MTRLIFQSIALLLLVVLAVTGYWEYFDYHQYYETLIGSSKNLLLVFWWLVWAAIPTVWLFFSKNPKPRWLFISTLIWLVFYGVCLVSIRWGLYGLWLTLLSRNTLVLFGLWVIQSVLFLAIGDSFKQWFLPDAEWSWQRVGVSFVLWIAIEILILYLFVLGNVLFPIVSRALFAGWIYRIWKCRESLFDAWQLVPQSISSLKQLIASKDLTDKIVWCLFVVIVVIWFWYIFNGFELSFMPYSTAWDANHAYMFYPKMRSFNNGMYWLEESMRIDPDLWYVFLTYWFSLFRRTDGIWAVSSDTIVLSINFWSGIYVLWLWSILVHTFSQFFSRKNIILLVWIGLIILWLTSGMGAFLVFVDNKTDLWVLSLIIWAIISGFVVLRSLDTENFWSISPNQKKALLISGFLYGIAALAKPTAMFDVINFAMYLWWMLIWPLGVVMLGLLVIGVLTVLEFRWIKDFIPQDWGKRFIWSGLLAGLWSIVATNKKKLLFGISVLLLWWAGFAATKIVVKVPHLLWTILLQEKSYTWTEFIKKIFLWKKVEDTPILLAQSSSASLASQCSLGGQWFWSTQELYDDLVKPSSNSYSEDNLRYMGFGWKWNPSDIRRWVTPFAWTWRAWLVPEWCSVISLNHRSDLNVLCENHEALSSFDTAAILEISTQIDAETYHGERIQQITNEIRSWDDEETVRSRINPQLQELLVFIESWTLYKNPTTQEIYLPYKRIIPFNVSYNWSLQNLSSYYTDIGIIWLICLIFSWVWVVYGLVARKRIVTVSSMVTLVAWTLWGLIASWIVRYSIGIIIWSILSFVGLVWSLFDNEDSQDRPIQQVIQVLFFAVLWWVVLVQLFLNMTRIASQWWSGAFMWYKASVWKQQVLDTSLQPTVKTVTWFNKQDVFDMQFPHYKPFIQAMNERNDDEWGFIAGTYIRYFVEDQSHIKYDAFLTWLREKFSDNNVCNSYLRLWDQKIRYVAIDLNIGTVVQWEWNRSLFDRFFARVNTVTNSIEEEGVISMLISLNQQWYIKYLSSNNIWAKYAFTMWDTLFNGLEGEQLRLFKSRMAVARYFRNDVQLMDSLVQIAQQRVQDATFVTDIADMLWLEVREEVLVGLIRSNQITQQQIEPLTEYERRALSQYLWFASMLESSPDEFVQQMRQTIQQSINNPNQILSLEVL
jgi:hypothetical protein